MCSPALSLGMQAAGAVQGAVGSYYSAVSQKSALNAQAQMAQLNAKMADNAADQTLHASEVEQSDIMLKGEQVKAAQTASYAGRGLDIGVGTPVQVATSTDYMTAVDRNRAAANGVAAAWGQRIQGVGYTNQALMDKSQASSISPLTAGITSLIGSAGQVAKSWYGASSAGTFGQSGNAGTSMNWGQVDSDLDTVSKQTGGIHIWGF